LQQLKKKNNRSHTSSVTLTPAEPVENYKLPEIVVRRNQSDLKSMIVPPSSDKPLKKLLSEADKKTIIGGLKEKRKDLLLKLNSLPMGHQSLSVVELKKKIE
jgi:hypothetical protein